MPVETWPRPEDKPKKDPVVLKAGEYEVKGHPKDAPRAEPKAAEPPKQEAPKAAKAEHKAEAKAEAKAEKEAEKADKLFQAPKGTAGAADPSPQSLGGKVEAVRKAVDALKKAVDADPGDGVLLHHVSALSSNLDSLDQVAALHKDMARPENDAEIKAERLRNA